MAQFSGGKSSLNPNAPLFVPASFRQVEDFSPEWWQLITTSTWYKDYWLSQHEAEDGFYNNAEEDFDNDDITNLLPDSFDLGELPSDLELQSEGFFQSLNTEAENRLPSEVEVAEIQMNNLSLLQSSPKASADPAKPAEKPVSDSSPGIQQPH